MTVSGLLNLNKPRGITSFKAVSMVKRAIGADKAGHCGTLDPEAEGVLLVLFGKATKLQEKFMSLQKTYTASVLFGTTTDSGDMAGKVISSLDVPANADELVRNVLPRFTGDIEQVPPMYSALKYGGKKLYELARQGREVPREPRKITIYSLKFSGICGKRAVFKVKCSRGTYIRTLVSDIGAAIGCCAVLESLTRNEIGPFKLADAVSIGPSVTRELLLSRIFGEDELSRIQN